MIPSTLTQSPPLYVIHGGAAEDFLLPYFVKNASQFSLKAVIVMNANSHGPTAMQVTHKIENFLNDASFPFHLSDARAQNAFPWAWRTDCLKITKLDLFPIQSVEGSHSKMSGEEYLTQCLSNEADQSVTLLMTGPWTPIQTVLSENTQLIKKIKQLFCMAGTFGEGNIFSDVVGGLNRPHSEWNIFWDSKAVSWIFNQGSIPITLVPIETCEELSLTTDFLEKLKKQSASSNLSKLALEIYELAFKESAYRFWNTATTLCLLDPSLCGSKETINATVISDSYSEEEGSLKKSETGREIQVITRLVKTQFYENLLKVLE